MKTLAQLIEEGAGQGERSVIAEVAAAAYWAGQSDMRGTITSAVAAQLHTLPTGRYHRLQRRAANYVLAVPQLNPNVLRAGAASAAYDDGKAEAGEILGWEFEVS